MKMSMKPKFKSGDRVESLITSGPILKGDTGTAVEDDGVCPCVRWDQNLGGVGHGKGGQEWCLEHTAMTAPKPTKKPTAPKPTKKPTAPKPTKEPKMPEPKETKSPLYTAVRDILEAKDRETLDARTYAKVSAVLRVLEGPTGLPVGPLGTLSEAIAHQAVPAPVASVQVPWSLYGLVIDPGEEAVGQWGWFWDEDGLQVFEAFGQCDKYNPDEADDGCPYSVLKGSVYTHFAYLPNFPGAALLKATTGYEAP
jgi:hypothetical protein